MNTKIIKLISTITFWIGIALSAFSIYTLISSSIGLPPGACPINDGRPFMIAAVVFLVASFVTSFFTGKKSRNGGSETNHKDG